MTPHRLLETGIKPALKYLEGHGIRDTTDARRYLLAIAIKESDLQNRRQVGKGGVENGPAVSFWQGELTGGMCLTLTHRSTSVIVKALCKDFNIDPTAKGLWDAMRYNDIVAAALARLLIYTLPSKLPTTSAQGWEQYIDAWRPGVPNEPKWPKSWLQATLELGLEP